MGAFIAPHALANARRREIGGSTDMASLARSILGDSSAVARLLRRVQPVDLTLVHELRSSFDRAPFFPDVAYQLAAGGIDDFRFHDGIQASGATDSRTRSGAAGLDLPLGLRARAIYQDLFATSWIRRGDTQGELRQRSREWPSGNVSWLYSPRWALNRVITTFTAQARYRETVTSTEQPSRGGSAGRTENRSTTVNPSATISWTGGILTGAQYARTTSDVVTSGNTTRSDRTDWGANLGFSFRAPAWLIRLNNPLRANGSWITSDILVCLVRSGTADCIPVSDSRRRQLDFRLDTGFSPAITGGASFSYVLTEQRHTATRLSQITFTAFAEINFSAGQLR
jgi:hypothetical protein